jgi:myo-inositol-1(or 4)-monophosphatase
MKNFPFQIISVVQEAGKIITEDFMNRKDIGQKGFGNYVTNVDYKVQEFLFDKLQAVIPASTFISEETSNKKFELGDATWIIDPIDGTTNFIHCYPHLAISVALYLEGQPFFGTTYNPITKELFHAQLGKGAFLNNHQIRVSPNKELDKCIVGFGLPYDRSKAQMVFKVCEHIFQQCQEVRRTGSAALDLAYVACGRLDGYFEMNLAPWDFGAGVLILKEAGGCITNWNNKTISATEYSNIVATNRYIHEAVINSIEQVEERCLISI